ncbi:MAG: exonuclease SbcCD subunit D [Candidatus Gracilibacteria bacterium]|nr:exonuclease SbcCD subunit D [Candidatus Gracilibacteria bacterium]
MKIFHFSDTHLGITLENTSREEDFYKNFEFIIYKILELKPDIVIHSGDLFHTSKPSNKAISVVVENFLKLEKAGIPVIIIAGNHDTPRLTLTTHPFEIFKSLNNFYVFYEPEIKSLEIYCNDKKSFISTNFIILPHIHDENIFKEELKKSNNLILNGKNNIFISHFGISAKKYDEYTDEISGINIALEDLKILKKFDYVALGHYHKQFNIGNITYPGSIEHTSFNQKNYKIGYNIFDTDLKTKESFELQSRPMIDLGNIDCKNIENTANLIEFLEKNINKDSLKNAIVKIILENLNSKLLLEFDEKLFLDFFKECFYFEYKKIKFIENRKISGNIKQDGNTILDNFENFFDNYNFTNKIENKDELKKELEELLKTK